ncbi:MAG TPA: phosphoesterase, partial [Candidatus Angelobacter sp.]
MRKTIVLSNRGRKLIGLVLLLAGVRQTLLAQDNAVIQWNNAALQEIRYLHTGPTINARALAIVHTCIFDAWSAFDAKAIPTALKQDLRRPVAERTEESKKKAVSFAAYRCLADLFPTEIAKLNAVMAGLGFDPADVSNDPATASGIGNLASAAVLQVRHKDGSNQLGDLHPGRYSDYTGYAPVNSPEQLVDPDHWQPLRTPATDGGLYGRFITQKFLTPQWGLVKPFALSSGSQLRPAKGPATLAADKEHYLVQAQELLQLSSDLTDEHKMIAEYWADGPNSETPPGHWCVFAQFVSARDHHTLDDDVKMFFLLTNAMLDAGIAAWDAKRAFDSVRPVTAIHVLFAGKPVRAWGGRFKGLQTIDGAAW